MEESEEEARSSRSRSSRAPTERQRAASPAPSRRLSGSARSRPRRGVDSERVFAEETSESVAKRNKDKPAAKEARESTDEKELSEEEVAKGEQSMPLKQTARKDSLPKSKSPVEGLVVLLDTIVQATAAEIRGTGPLLAHATVGLASARKLVTALQKQQAKRSSS